MFFYRTLIFLFYICSCFNPKFVKLFSSLRCDDILNDCNHIESQRRTVEYLFGLKMCIFDKAQQESTRLCWTKESVKRKTQKTWMESEENGENSPTLSAFPYHFHAPFHAVSREWATDTCWAMREFIRVARWIFTTKNCDGVSWILVAVSTDLKRHCFNFQLSCFVLLFKQHRALLSYLTWDIVFNSIEKLFTRVDVTTAKGSFTYHIAYLLWLQLVINCALAT